MIALTGPLGAGKTTVLNSLLRAPGARLGVVVNDFGEINLDAAMVTGQVDEPASIAGGCLCCLPDAGGLDDALDRLGDPRLRLDAILVEASGMAEPLTVHRLLRLAASSRVRFGALLDVVDATGPLAAAAPPGQVRRPPVRFAAASLVVVTKLEALPEAERAGALERISAAVRAHHDTVPIVAAAHGELDPDLVLDVASSEDPPDQLPLAALAREARAEHLHHHATAVTIAAAGPVDPGRVLDLLEDPPAGVVRIKGRFAVETSRSYRHYDAHLAGRHIHVAPSDIGGGPDALVAIGMELRTEEVRARLEAAVAPPDGPVAAGMRRLVRYRRLSMPV